MGDFIIKKTNGKELGVDDFVMNEAGTQGKYIERYSHKIKTVNMNEVSEVRRERTGWQGGPGFSDKQKGTWKHPV